jgi:hypothetical protein
MAPPRKIDPKSFCALFFEILKKHYPDQYTRIRPSLMKFKESCQSPAGQAGAYFDSQGNGTEAYYTKLIGFVETLVSSQMFLKLQEVYHKRMSMMNAQQTRYEEWKSKGFLSDPMNDIEQPLHVTNESMYKLWQGDIPNSISLHREQYELITSSHNDFQAPFPSHIPETLPLEVSFNQYMKSNILTPRMAWARLRLPNYNDWENSARASTVAKWEGLQTAKNDRAAAMLSCATEVFIKRILTGAVRSAQRDAELDGVRLYEAVRKTDCEPAPLGMVIGCDLLKQVAQSHVAIGKTILAQEKHLAQKYKNMDQREPSNANNNTTASHRQNVVSSMTGKYVSASPSMGSLGKRKYDENRVKEMSGMIQKLETYVKGLDEGSHPIKVVPKDGVVKVDVAHIKAAVAGMAEGAGIGRKRNTAISDLWDRQGR